MSYFLLKIGISALLIALISELSNRYSLLAALLASLPLTSILALTWIYLDTKDTQKIAAMSYDIFWLVIPSLLFFLLLPALLKAEVKFVPAMLISCAVLVAVYSGAIAAYKWFQS